VEITVEGWSRNHGAKRVVSRSLLKTKLSGQISQSEIGANVTVQDPKNPSENTVSIYFHTNLLGSSDYLANLYLSFEEIDKIYALALSRREAGEATRSLARHL
jgi:hypothetical protein